MLNKAPDDLFLANLIEDIVEDSTNLEGLSSQQIDDIINFSVTNDDYRALDVIANIHNGIYDYNDRNPEWLKSEFCSHEWTLEFGKTSRVISWNSIILDDGLRLTNKKHLKLLNSFKYWITAADNPLENGGKLISRTTACNKVNRIITFINAILLHSDGLNLSKLHLQKVNDDFWLSILTNYAEFGGVNGIYETEKRLKALLDQASHSVTCSDVTHIKKNYPYVERNLSPDEKQLYLEQRDKACAWLFKQGFYRKGHGVHYTGNGSVINKLLFEGRMLYQGYSVPTYPELHLKEPTRHTEYRAVINRDVSLGTSFNNLSAYIEALRLIHTNLEHEDSATPQVISEMVNAGYIKQLVDLKKIGRTRTLPPNFVFRLIRKCYEFSKKHLSVANDKSNLLDEVLNVVTVSKHKSTQRASNPCRPTQSNSSWNEKAHRDMSGSVRGYWFQSEAINCVSSDYRSIGVKQIQSISPSCKERHERVRANESLFDLFSVLQGSVQILVGALMARRQSELVQLSPYNNLSPRIDPFSSEAKNANYSLIFRVKKTGSKGLNAFEERPIPLSIAKFIWQLEQFNIKVEELNLNSGKLSLFNSLNSHLCLLSKTSHTTYNNHLDTLSDYIEADLVEYQNGEFCRNYVRQHQLRRFFAMAFFWSKGFDGMDALRWMLAHSDLEHLYHYISESETGEVLNGAKASVIVRGVVDSTSDLAMLEGIEEVRQIVTERITGDSSIPITIESTSEAVTDYNDESYITIPHISQLQKEQEVEAEVLSLLEEERITFEPEFFTVLDSNGNETKSFNLILKIKDLS